MRSRLNNMLVLLQGSNRHVLLTKREVKMTGYLPSSVFTFL